MKMIFCNLSFVLSLAPALVLAPPARAALGGDVATLVKAQSKASVKVSSQHLKFYDVHETAESKTTVRQFAAPNGKIFAVAWKGRAHPDLAELMGTHMADFTAAMKLAKQNRHGHSPISVEVNGFHLEMAGNSRALQGRAWLNEQVPSTVSTNDIH